MIVDRSRKTREISRRAHFHSRGYGGSMIGLSPGICARSSASRAVRADNLFLANIFNRMQLRSGSILEGRHRCHRQLQVTRLAIPVCKN